MAAYAALVSLEHIIDNLRLHHCPPIVLHKEQARLLTQKVTFLQQFLEVYNPNLPYSKEADPLESRIARAAYAAEDAIESHIFDQFNHNGDGERTSSDGLYEALEKVIQDMALIQKDAMEIKEIGGIQNQQHPKSTPPTYSSRLTTSSIAQVKNMMVGNDDLLLEMKDKLTSDARDLQTIPIVGMGGSGKTTLALNIYQDSLIVEHFDIRAWVTFSQEYSIGDILIHLLTQLINEPINKELTASELGEMLHKHLYGGKYMIILDDMWSVKAWDGVKWFLPNNKKGSRIVITTRLDTLASALPNSSSLVMKLLDDDESWDLLSKTVFGEKGRCPSELEDIGKEIGRSCKGLPLSIVVVGGLLAKAEQTIEYWENMEDNLNVMVNLEDGELCFKTLYMSYKQLPVHLKPCFLCMGIYREDHEISVSKLIKLWVAEGFLKPVFGKRLEDVARECLNDLIGRNLIMIHELGSIGSIKVCKVHDLLRDLCLREAQKQGFYTVYPGQEIGDNVDRIVMSGSTIQETEDIDVLSSAVPLARSLILDLDLEFGLPSHLFRLLRISHSNVASNNFIENVEQLLNSWFDSFTGSDNLDIISIFFSIFFRLFWNLQTFISRDTRAFSTITLPTDIWYMSYVRHLHNKLFYLPDPPPNDIVLANLQSLGRVKDFRCSEQMVKTIPNITKLQIFYDEAADDRFCLNNLDCLDKLESLTCGFRESMCPINYPHSLKKLHLAVHESQCWRDVLDKIGALPLLQKLKLSGGSFKAGEWETTEGQFRSLKYLSLARCFGLRVWTSEASHFPLLEQLHLREVRYLEEIPLDFADISTLTLIYMRDCSDPAVESAKRILEEQEALYGEEDTTLQVQVGMSEDVDPELKKSLGSRNFIFI